MTDLKHTASEENTAENNAEDTTEDTPFSLEAVALNAQKRESEELRAQAADSTTDGSTSQDAGAEENPFAALGLVKPLLKALNTDGYTKPTPIQIQAIPALLEGKDIIGCAQTGTGKTAAFALPLLQHLFRNPKPTSSKHARILVLSPTRELAGQIHTAFGSYGRYMTLRRTAVFGGVSAHQQIRAMGRGVDVLVATPGRLLDLINQGSVRLGEVEALVLDEADRMLDMGFIHDIRKIAAMCPADRQTLMFSATMEPAIAKLAKALLHMPVRVDVAPQSTTAETVEQHVLFMERPEKFNTVLDMLKNGGRFGGIYKALIFTRTKHGANRLDAQLHKAGIKTTAIHGNKSQNQRKKALDIFKNGHMQVMVATDVAARGLDIDDISHVINYDMPTEPDAYVHRIGRTGRAGNDGIAISLCDGGERGLLRDIERTIGKSLTGDALPPPAQRSGKKKSAGNGKGKGQGNGKPGGFGGQHAGGQPSKKKGGNKKAKARALKEQEFKAKGPKSESRHSESPKAEGFKKTDDFKKSEGFKKKKSFKRKDDAQSNGGGQSRDQSRSRSETRGETRQNESKPGEQRQKRNPGKFSKDGSSKPKRVRQNKRGPGANKNGPGGKPGGKGRHAGKPGGGRHSGAKNGGGSRPQRRAA